MKKLLFLLILLSSLFVSAKAAAAAAEASDKTEVMKVSRQAVLALRDKNMAKLAALVHPAKGVRFSAYGYIDKDGDLVFKRALIAGLLDSKKIYTWGEYDGSGDPIKMRFAKYYAQFIYDRDFSRAPQVDYNNVIGRGNTIVNVKEAYPNGKFVEYHFSEGADKNVMGWNSLRLIFEKSGAKWYLAGICHDEWTI